MNQNRHNKNFPINPIPLNGAEWGEKHDAYFEGIRYRWRTLGKESNPPIVFIHGFGANSAHWRFNAADFAEAGFKVFALDLIGFGESDQIGKSLNNTLDNRLWAKQLNNFLDKIVIGDSFQKAILIGNSLGALVALTLLANQPSFVKALIAFPLPDPAFVSSYNLPEKPIIKNLKIAFIKALFNILPLKIIIKIILGTPLIKVGIQSAYCRDTSKDDELYSLITRPAKRKTAAMALRAMCIGMFLRPKEATAPFLLDSVLKRGDQPPVLILWGRQDKLVPLEIGHRIYKKHSWLRFSILEKTGHCPHDDNPLVFNKFVLNWLETNSGSK